MDFFSDAAEETIEEKIEGGGGAAALLRGFGDRESEQAHAKICND
jgi:hypothetical protein